MAVLAEHRNRDRILAIRTRIETKLQPFPLRFYVEYAYAVALTVQHLETSAEARKCLELVAKWLNDENSVTEEELESAYYADLRHSAASLATVIIWSVLVVHTVPGLVAINAANVGKKNQVKKMLEYEGMLDEKINNLSEIERLIYNCKG